MISKNNLEKMYWDQEMSQKEIAKVVNVSVKAISKLMTRYKIKTRTFSEINLIGINVPSKNELTHMYWNNNMTMLQIADKIGVSQRTINIWMRKYDIKSRTISESTGGKNNANWKGGISFEPYCEKFNSKFKEAVRIRDNCTCQLCGFKQNGRKLSVHHIHYDKTNCWPDVVALCCSCNTKVNSNRSYWEEYFGNQLLERGLYCWSLHQ